MDSFRPDDSGSIHSSIDGLEAPASDFLDVESFGQLPGGAKLVPATLADFATIRNIHRVAMRPSLEPALGGWDDEGQGRWLASHIDMTKTWLIVQNEAVVGSLSIHERPGEVYVELLQLKPEAQGRGIGAAILSELTWLADEKCQPLTLSVMQGSAAIALYARHGFTLTDENTLQQHLRREPVAVTTSMATLRDASGKRTKPKSQGR